MVVVSERELRALIEDHREFVDFGEYGQGASNNVLRKAETAIGLRLPPSLRWWLKAYGGGEILGEEVFSIYEGDLDAVASGDIVRQYFDGKTRGQLPDLQLPVCHSDIDGLFCIDLSRDNGDGESPVVSVLTGRDYAVDFSDFLRKRILLGIG